jgi:hypothetical protein
VSLVAEPTEVSRVLAQALDDGLSVPGEIVRTAIYDRIEKSYGLKREDIPEKLEVFHRALEDLMGESAKVMEKLIAKKLCSHLGLDFAHHDGWTLVEYVNHAREVKRDDSRSES